MVLTDQQLNENYYYACLFVAGPPYVFSRSDVCIRDDGDITPSPYIYIWTVNGITQPLRSYLLANISMSDITTIKSNFVFS